MELKEAEKQAKALMTAHGVGYLQFAFDNGKRRLGATHFVRQGKTVLPIKITLSRHYVVLLPEQEVLDVMLHEIAHALAGIDAGHGPQWRTIARRIGAKGTRCAQPSAAPPAPIHGICPTCDDMKVSEHHRMPRAAYVHRTCRTPLKYVRV